MVSKKRHSRPTGAGFILWRLGRTASLFGLLLLFLSPTAEALDGDEGSYVFNDLETGKAITVWYAKPAVFSVDTPIVIVLHGQNRNARSYRNVWKEYVNPYGFMLLVPEFSEGLFPGNQYEHGHYFAVTPAQAKKNKTSPPKKSSQKLVI